ncbi:MAG: hypothetical protein IPK29_15770 [Betaproteobacteria bacterium]|nr:hypothetical protein [Betaproteobacteria bacterium]
MQISDQARAIYRSSLVWDMTVPYGMQHATDGITLPRFKTAGFGLVSLTLGGDKTFGPEAALANISKVYAVCARHPGCTASCTASMTWTSRARKASWRSR